MTKAKEVLGKLGDAGLQRNWQAMAGGATLMAMPKVALFRSVVLNHWYHHRGQLSVYLRLLDVPVPAIYGASADENPFASADVRKGQRAKGRGQRAKGKGQRAR